MFEWDEEVSDTTAAAATPSVAEVVEPQPIPQDTLLTLTPPGELTAGNSFWFEGEVPFHILVKQLQEEGQLPQSPYKLPLPYLSVSQVELYQRCPAQFYWRYIMGQRRPPGVAMVQGTTIHKAVEEGYKKVMAGETPELEFVLDTYSGELDKNLEGEVVWDASEESEDITSKDKDKGKVKDTGVNLLKKWHKEKLPRVKPRAVEKSFVTTFGNVPVVGRVDLVDRISQPLTPEAGETATGMHPLLDAVVDNKVVSKTYTQAMVNSKMQMTLYAHASGVPRQRYDLFVKTKIPKITELMTSRDAGQIRWAVKTFVDVAKAISAGSFPPCSADQFWCCEKWCGYYGICRGAM